MSDERVLLYAIICYNISVMYDSTNRVVIATYTDNTKRLISLLRLIVRSIDLHSHFLSKEVGLTIPQLLILQEIRAHNNITSMEASMNIKVSAATVSGIMSRLKSKGYINRTRDTSDRRKVRLTLTDKGERVLANDPLPIQRQFVEKFTDIDPKQQHAMLDSLEILATLMFESSSAATNLQKWVANHKENHKANHKAHDDSMH